LDGGKPGLQSSFGERRLVIEGILTGMIEKYRRRITWAKWEEGKKVFD